MVSIAGVALPLGGREGGSGPETARPGAIWLLLALGVFLLQSVPYLASRWVTDESWYAGPGYSLAHGEGLKDPEIGPNDLEHRFDARPPGTALVIGLFFRVIGVGADTARLGSVLAGLVSVGLTFFLTRDLLGARGSVAATLLMATDNLIVLTARTARPEALTVMAILAAAWAVKSYLDGGARSMAALCGALMAAATMFHITVLGYILSMGVLVVWVDVRARRPFYRGGLLYTLGYAAGLVPYAVWIATAPLGRLGFRQEFLARAVYTSLWGKLAGEGRRYADVVGLHMLHGHGLEQLPVRLPIPLCFLAATVVLWRFRRTWFYVELVLLLPSVLWLIYTVNKSSRYVSLLAPVFAIAIGAAVSVGERRGRAMAGLAIAGLVIAAQAGANLVLLRSASKADYTRVGAELRGMVPPSETVYGSITFWLAFRNQTFISYERTEPLQAADDYGARYFILGDRTMVEGTKEGDPYYATLDRGLAQIVARSTRVGVVSDPYYGELSVYRLNR